MPPFTFDCIVRPVRKYPRHKKSYISSAYIQHERLLKVLSGKVRITVEVLEKHQVGKML